MIIISTTRGSRGSAISSSLSTIMRFMFQKMATRRNYNKLTLQACIVLSLFVLSQLTFPLAESAGVQRRLRRDSGVEVELEGEAKGSEGMIDELENEDKVTTLVENKNTTQNTTSVENSDSKSSTGAVVAASVIAVLLCCAIVLGVYFFKRKRESRIMDKEKKMQIQMSSARNAGVYQDLTVSVPNDDKPNDSPEHERLKAVEDA